MLLTPEILVNIVLDALIVLLGAIAFVVSWQVILFWETKSRDAFIYTLQKRLYLSATVSKYIFFVKIPLFFYFIYTLDKLSLLIPGAMCGVGVLDSSQYGIYLILLKIINIYMIAFWILLNEEDYKHPQLPYARIKSLFFLGIYPLLLFEIVLEFLFFHAINPHNVVDCCGVVFSAADKTLMGSLLQAPKYSLFLLFYATFTAMLLSAFLRLRQLYAFLGAVMIPVALLSLIGYFGTYIYELPTHHCPFCMLQSDYGYVGYVLYFLLFMGTFYAVASGFFPQKSVYMKRSLLFVLLYALLVSYYPIAYYLQKGTWLY